MFLTFVCREGQFRFCCHNNNVCCLRRNHPTSVKITASACLKLLRFLSRSARTISPKPVGNPLQKYCFSAIPLLTIDDKCRQLPITTNNCYLSSSSISYFSQSFFTTQGGRYLALGERLTLRRMSWSLRSHELNVERLTPAASASSDLSIDLYFAIVFACLSGRCHRPELT